MFWSWGFDTRPRGDQFIVTKSIFCPSLRQPHRLRSTLEFKARFEREPAPCGDHLVWCRHVSCRSHRFPIKPPILECKSLTPLFTLDYISCYQLLPRGYFGNRDDCGFQCNVRLVLSIARWRAVTLSPFPTQENSDSSLESSRSEDRPSRQMRLVFVQSRRPRDPSMERRGLS